jgi:hypothetical protein
LELQWILGLLSAGIIWNALSYFLRRKKAKSKFFAYKAVVLAIASILFLISAYISWSHQFDGLDGHGMPQKWLFALMVAAGSFGLLHCWTAARDNHSAPK